MTLLASTGEPVSAPTNATMVTSGPTALCIPGPDSNFSNSIKDNLVEFFAVQNPCPTIPEFTWPALGNWQKANSHKFYNVFKKSDACYQVECF